MFSLRINPRYADEGSTLQESLFKKSCVDAVECALRSSSKKLESIASRGLDFGGRVGYGDLRAIFPEVKSKVDSYLGVSFISEPLVTFGSASTYSDGVVFVQSGRSAWVIPALAHEYCHHVQVEYMASRELLPVLCEGHAVGVERHVAENFAEESGNESFLLYPLLWQVARLKSSYQWICSNLKVRPDRSLITCNSVSDHVEERHLRKNGRPTTHAIGTAFFTLIPPVFKDSAYKEFLTGSLYF